MKKILVANWKMNPTNAEKAVSLAKAEDFSGVVIAPPFSFLEDVKKAVKNAEVGAQDVFWENVGAYTGEISPEMLKNAGVSYVIIGHSERRSHLKETDEMINKKVAKGLAAGLKVILCVGEGLNIRNQGISEVEKFVKHQLAADLKGINNFKAEQLVIAYEPVWAIGSGKADNPDSAATVHKFIKKALADTDKQEVKVIYGGSVNSKNITAFIDKEEIDGALVGGASLDAQEFKKIYEIFKRG